MDQTSALAQSPERVLRWLAAAAGTAALATRVQASPSMVGVIALAAAATAIASTPALAVGSAAAVLLVAAIGTAVGLEPVWLAAAAAGAVAAWSAPWKTDLLDYGLASTTAYAGATLGSALTAWLRSDLPMGVMLGAGIALSAVCILPIARRRDHPDPPSAGTVRRLLDDPFRPLALRATRLYEEASPMAPSAQARRELHALATATLSLQTDRQRLHHERSRLDVEQLTVRASNGSDRARAHATRMLEHHDALHRKEDRIAELAEMAVDHLEEARASFALGSLAPANDAEDTAARLLEQIRNHSIETRARDGAAQELAQLPQLTR